MGEHLYFVINRISAPEETLVNRNTIINTFLDVPTEMAMSMVNFQFGQGLKFHTY